MSRTTKYVVAKQVFLYAKEGEGEEGTPLFNDHSIEAWVIVQDGFDSTAAAERWGNANIKDGFRTGLDGLGGNIVGWAKCPGSRICCARLGTSEYNVPVRNLP